MFQLVLKDKYGNEILNDDYVVVGIKLYGDISNQEGLNLYPRRRGEGVRTYMFVGKVISNDNGIYIQSWLVLNLIT